MYETLRELKEAIDSGVLDREQTILTVDNDDVYAFSEDCEYADLFRSDPHSLLTQALDLLGIRWDDA